MSDNGTATDSSDRDLTRRGILGLASVAGVSLFSTTFTGSASAAAGDPLYVDGSNAMEADLDLGVNSVTEVNNVEAGHNFSSFSSSGTGNGHLQLFDTNANSYHLRTFEGAEAADGETEAPGHVEFQAPIRGAREEQPGTPDPGPLRIEDGTVADAVSVRDWNLVDVVAEPSIDETGDLGAEIQAYLNDQSTINHCFVVPAGTYIWNSAVDQDQFQFLGVVGKPRATLDVQTNEADIAFDLGDENGNGKRATLRNLTVDISGTDPDGDDLDAGLAKGHIEESFELEHLELTGQRHKLQSDQDKQGDRFTVLSQLVSRDGVGRIHDVTLAGGDVAYPGEESVGHAIPFSVDPAHEGTNVWTGCYVEGFVDNGFYVQNSPGRNVLTGCTAKNNSGGSIRLGANDVCRDSTVIIDEAPDHDVRPLFLNNSIQSGSPPRAENVTIYAPNTKGGHALQIKERGGIVRNVRIEHGIANDATEAPPTIKVTGNGSATLENVTVHDTVDNSLIDGDSRRFSVEIIQPDTTVRNLELYIDEEEEDLREGIAFDSRFGLLERCFVDIPNDGDAVEVRSDESSVVNCRFEGRSDKNATFEAYSSVDLDTVHVHGCRFTDVDLKSLSKADVSSENFYRQT